MKHGSCVCFLTILAVLAGIFFGVTYADGTNEFLGIKKGECYDVKKFGCSLTAKLDANLYELRCQQVMDGLAILKTNEAIFENTGGLVGLSVQKIGVEKVPLANGFLGQATVFKECAVDYKSICNLQWRQPNLAIPIKTKACDRVTASEKAKKPSKSYNGCVLECAEKFPRTNEKSRKMACYDACNKN